MSETTMDWRAFLTEGLLPMGRVHLTIKDTRVTEKENDDGEKYKSIGVQIVIDMHEDADSEGILPNGTKFKPVNEWMNFYLRGKTLKRFRSLYAGCTGRAIQPTSRDAETGKPVIDIDAVVRDLNGLGCYTAYIWRELEDGTYEGNPGWDFAQKIDEIRPPKNKFLEEEKKEDEEKEGE